MSAAAAVSSSTSAAAATAASSLRLCDVGINLLDDMFQGKYHGKQRHEPDLPLVLSRARAFGVHQMIITAGMLDETIEAAEMARKLGCFSTVGCHPTRANEFLKKAPTPEQYVARLRQVIDKYKDVVVAIGECGLDYDRLCFCDKETQLRFFPLQIMLAAEYKLPLFLHNRNTGRDFIDICTKYKDEIAQAGGGVVHSFTGTAEELAELQELGFYISVNGCSFKEDWQLDVARKIKLNRLMLETDAPWCSVKATHAGFRLLAAHKDMLAADFKGLGLPETEPAVKKAEKFEKGSCVKDRCEPKDMVTILKIMYCLRKEEVPGGPFGLAAMVWYNTKSLFKHLKDSSAMGGELSEAASVAAAVAK